MVQSEIAATTDVVGEYGGIDIEYTPFTGYCDLSVYQHGAKKKKSDLQGLDPQDFSMVIPQKHYGPTQAEENEEKREEDNDVREKHEDTREEDQKETSVATVRAGQHCDDLNRDEEQWDNHLNQTKKKRVCDKVVFEKKLKIKDACEIATRKEEYGEMSANKYFLKEKQNLLKQFDWSEQQNLVDACGANYAVQRYAAQVAEDHVQWAYLINGYPVYAKNKNRQGMDLYYADLDS